METSTVSIDKYLLDWAFTYKMAKEQALKDYRIWAKFQPFITTMENTIIVLLNNLTNNQLNGVLK